LRAIKFEWINIMNTLQRIAKNVGVKISAKIISKILGFFFIIYVARYLGVEGFGILSFALAFAGIFGVLANFGLGPLAIREVARDKSLARKYLGNIIGIKIILVIIVFGLIALTINILGYPAQTIKVVYLIALFVIFNAFTDIFNSIFQAFEKIEYVSIGMILNSGLLLLSALLAINQGFGIIGFAFLYFFASVIIFGYSFIVSAWKFVKPRIEIDWDFWKSSIKQALPFGLAMFFVTIFYWIDSVMLSLMKGNEVVGWYNVSYRIALFLLFIPQAFTSAIFPVMSRFYLTSQDYLRLSFEKHFKYMAVLGVPIGVGIMLLSRRFILLLFGIEYLNSIVPLQILIWSSVFIFMSQPIANLFNSVDRQVIVTKIVGICVVFNVVLNLILIPKYSLIGASVATVFTEFAVLALCFIWGLKIKYTISTKELIKIIGSVLIASALMSAFIIYFYDLTLLALVPLAALLYFVVLYIIGGINKEEINLILVLFRKQKDEQSF